MEHLFVVVSRYRQTGLWMVHTDCLFAERRLVDNYCEILSKLHPERQYRVGEITILEPESPAEADAEKEHRRKLLSGNIEGEKL